MSTTYTLNLTPYTAGLAHMAATSQGLTLPAMLAREGSKLAQAHIPAQVPPPTPPAPTPACPRPSASTRTEAYEKLLAM